MHSGLMNEIHRLGVCIAVHQCLKNLFTFYVKVDSVLDYFSKQFPLEFIRFICLGNSISLQLDRDMWMVVLFVNK